MPVSVTTTQQGDFKYETPFLQEPQGRVSIGIASGALNTSVAQIVDSDGVLRPGAVFARHDGSYEPVRTTTDTYSVQAVSTANDEVEISGDLLDRISKGDLIKITGSTGNDGVYRVEAASYDSGSTQTVITVKGNIGDSTADGDVHVAEVYEMVGLVPYSLNLFSDNDSSTLSGHGKMSVVVATKGEVILDRLTDQLGRSLEFEEEAAIEAADDLTLVRPA